MLLGPVEAEVHDRVRRVEQGVEVPAEQLPLEDSGAVGSPVVRDEPLVLRQLHRGAAVGNSEPFAAELGVDMTQRTKVIKVEEPQKRKGGVKVKSVAELVDKLKNEAKVVS